MGRMTTGGRASRAGAIAVSAAFALGGCATQPSVRPADTVLPQTFTQATPLPTVAIDRWWTLFDDPQLDGLIERALARGFSTREAFARLDEARATRAMALSRFGINGDLQATGEERRTHYLATGNLDLPGLPAGASLGDLFAPSATRTANATLPVSWELDLFGRRRATRDVAEADLAAARFSYEGARATLVADVARRLFDARGLAAQLEDARALAADQRRLLAASRAGVARGLTAASAADRIAADLMQSEAQATDLAAALDASRRALLVLTGQGNAAIATLVITPVALSVPAVPASLPGDLLVRRPDVREAEARLTAAGGNVRLAKLALYPTITPQLTLGAATQTGGIANSTLFGALGAGLVAPIFDRARLKAELRASGARAEQAVLAYERIVQTAWSEADQALIRLGADRQRMATLSEGLGKARRAFDAAWIRQSRGLADLEALLDAQRTYRAARTALTGAQVDAQLRAVQAFQALGGGWIPSQPRSSPPLALRE